MHYDQIAGRWEREDITVNDASFQNGVETSMLSGSCLWMSEALAPLTFPWFWWNNSEGGFKPLGCWSPPLSKNQVALPAASLPTSCLPTALCWGKNSRHSQCSAPHTSITWACWLSWHKALSFSQSSLLGVRCGRMNADCLLPWSECGGGSDFRSLWKGSAIGAP